MWYGLVNLWSTFVAFENAGGAEGRRHNCEEDKHRAGFVTKHSGELLVAQHLFSCHLSPFSITAGLT